ncbi:MAG: reverse gyrase [Paracoccaceae bacterium]
MKKGENEAVVISLDGTLYFGEATGMRGNITKGYSGGYVVSDDPQFVDDIARKYVMTVFPEKEYAFEVNLNGTYKAIEEARECNKKVMG